MVRRDDLSSRLQRIQEEATNHIAPATIAVNSEPHVHGLAAEMYNDPLLIAIALHFEEDSSSSEDDAESEGELQQDNAAVVENPAVSHAVIKTSPTTPNATQQRQDTTTSGKARRVHHTTRHNPNIFGGDIPSRSGQPSTRRVRRAENDLNLLRTANVEFSMHGEANGGTRLRAMHDQIHTQEERSMFGELMFDGTEESDKNHALWEQFLQLNEEKQRRVLRKLDTCTGGANNYSYKPKPKDDFGSIDKHLRQMLIRQKPSPTMVRQVEDCVIAAFVKEPHSVQVYRKLDAFRRSLYHSVCQYAKLKSKTLSSSSKSKQKRGSGSHGAATADVEVNNAEKTFERPKLMLSEYLEKKTSSNNR